MASTDCFKPPPGKYIGLWKDDEYSDVLIRLVQQDTENDVRTGAEEGLAAGGMVLLGELKAHRKVLRESSSYFRGLLTTGKLLAAAAVSKQKSSALLWHNNATGICASYERELSVYVIPCNSTDEAIAFENVIMYMYTHSFPPNLPLSTLFQMTSAADYLGSELCLTACLHAVGNHKQAEACSLQETGQAISIMKRQPQPDDVEQKIYQRCVDSINSELNRSNAAAIEQQSALLMSTLLECFGDVWSVVQHDKLRAPFVSLSLQAIELWGASSELQVDSENSITVLINEWLSKQPGSVQTLECKKQLTALVRLPLLSYSYLHYVIHKHCWFRPPVPEFRSTCAYLQHTGKKPEEQAWFLNNIPRAPCKQKQCTFEWKVPLDALQRVAGADVSGSKPVHEVSRRAYWQGICSWLRLSWSPDDECLQVEIASCSNFCYKDSEATAFASLDCEVQSTIGHFSSKRRTVLLNVGWDKCNWVRALQFPQLKTNDIATELAGKLEPDNSLLVTVIISNVF